MAKRSYVPVAAEAKGPNPHNLSVLCPLCNRSFTKRKTVDFGGKRCCRPCVRVTEEIQA
jgi:hypothetical protein